MAVFRYTRYTSAMTTKKIRAIPSGMELAPTLARRLFQLREWRNLTVRDLARSSRFTVQRIEDLESGLETWLSASDRQILAKALSVEPRIIEEVERRPLDTRVSEFAPRMEDLNRVILEGERDLSCPECQEPLAVSVQEGFDLEGLPIRFAKAYCTRCPFVLK